jgi:Carboxypeptidase regulatory-like domain
MGRMLKAFVWGATLLGPVSQGQEKTFDVRGSVVLREQGLPNLDVSLRAKGTGEERKTLTDQSGAFSFDGLPQGHYDLQVGKESVTVPPLSPFSLYVNLNVDRALTLLLPMEPYPCRAHYFRLLDPGGDKNLFALSGTVMNEIGTPIQGSDVLLYAPPLGRVATTHTNAEGLFSFTRLPFRKDYWVQVVSDGYYVGEFTRLEVLPEYETVYLGLALEPCERGHCEPYLRKIPIHPVCE